MLTVTARQIRLHTRHNMCGCISTFFTSRLPVWRLKAITVVLREDTASRQYNTHICCRKASTGVGQCLVVTQECAARPCGRWPQSRLTDHCKALGVA